MGDIARCSVGRECDYYNEELLYKLFGVNAELLIDHAWGYEPCSMKDIKEYKPETSSISSGQVLHCPYDFEKARLIVREMADLLALDLVESKIMTDKLTLTVGYDIENLKDSDSYSGDITVDFYGRRIPKHAHGTANIGKYTSSSRLIIKALTDLYERIVNPKLLVRRINITANRVVSEEDRRRLRKGAEQISIFDSTEALARERDAEDAALEKEKHIQTAIIDIKKKYGKNAILKGMNFFEGATTGDRNGQIGGHKA